MPIITSTQLFSDIRAEKLNSLYVLIGKQTFMLEKAVDKIVSKATGHKKNGFNYKKFDGDNFDFSDFSDAIETYMFTQQRKVVLLNDINFESLNATQLEKLKQSVSDIDENTIVIITSKSYDANLKKDIKLKSFIKEIEKTSQIVEFNLSDEKTLVNFICDHFSRHSLKISQVNAKAFINRLGGNYQIIMNELEKLENYAQDTEITLEMINEVTVENVEESIYSLAKFILFKNAKKAFEIIKNLYNQRLEPIIIAATLNRAFVDLYRAKCGVLAGLSPNEIAKSFKYKGVEFRITNAVNDVKHISLTQIKICLNLLVEADKKLKSSKVDRRLLLEQTTAQIIANL